MILRRWIASCRVSVWPCTLFLLRELDARQPEIVEAPYQRLEVVQVIRLPQVCVCLELIAGHEVGFDSGTCHHGYRNRLQLKACLDTRQIDTTVHSW